MGTASVRVLVVDDHEGFRAAASAMIAVTPGFVLVGEVDSGEAALAVIRTISPELVLMDVNMPGMGGMRACELLRRDHPTVVVVLVSTGECATVSLDRASSAPFVSKASLSPESLQTLWRDRMADRGADDG